MIYLIGSMNNQILGSKLPQTLRDLINECTIFWKKARIPTKDRADCMKKLKKSYEVWRSLEKRKKRESETFKFQVKEFEQSLDNLFDIAHANAFDIMKIDIDKEFLRSQRKPGRPGCLLGVDMKLSQKEKRKKIRINQEKTKRKKYENELSNIEMVETLEFTTSEEEEEKKEDGGSMVLEEDHRPCTSGIQRATKEIMTPRLSAALDKCKVSDRDAVHLLTACVESVSLNPSDYIINRTSIKKCREIFRKKVAEKVHSDFCTLNIDFVIVHWDTKLLPNLSGQEKVDRLPVIASSPNVEQLLGVPQIPSGTGSEISSAVYDSLEKWLLLDKVQDFVFDTTASNTGRLNGASTLLEQRLSRDILFLACRHHVSELIMQAAFNEAKLHIISPKREEVLSFCFQKITEDHPRDDYKEFIELVIIVFGDIPPGGLKIRQPGAYHQASYECDRSSIK
ncbi:uncharacterized protein LOC112679535 [Sipha flava]|uniref:Uncharacterized protein LOC112679535 n=1 Tax=Sipha flava TaxID=143950 RepID=A0A8B8F4D3_9HEMI|nr:uncharacterized protein LOC112679535 [Sipha flava]